MCSICSSLINLKDDPILDQQDYHHFWKSEEGMCLHAYSKGCLSIALPERMAHLLNEITVIFLFLYLYLILVSLYYIFLYYFIISLINFGIHYMMLYETHLWVYETYPRDIYFWKHYFKIKCFTLTLTQNSIVGRNPNDSGVLVGLGLVEKIKISDLVK